MITTISSIKILLAMFTITNKLGREKTTYDFISMPISKAVAKRYVQVTIITEHTTQKANTG